jgi:acyl-coenzyme A synthetase/AMP-(fatty) acid ligase
MEKSKFLIYSGQEYLYEQLLMEVNSLTELSSHLKEANIYQFYVKLVGSLLSQTDVTLLDNDFSETELNHLLGTNVSVSHKVDFSVRTVDELLQKVLLSKSKINLFTSGTTGRPKKVVHTFESISKGILTRDKFVNSKWLFTYSETHMAGLQVFFQAFLNKNLICYAYKAKRSEILELLTKYNITHISATPTFYRLLLPFNRSLYTIKSVAIGGEKSTSTLYEQLILAFPKAKIINIYASTEGGSLFTSIKSDVFTISSRLQGLVKISNNELYLHQNLIGNIEVGNSNTDEWYSTGDLVEIITEEPLSFKFLSRKSEVINIGGYKVNPQEVEQRLLEIPIISLCVVYKQSNDLIGNILCADIVLNDMTLEVKEARKMIKTHLKRHLQQFKIPRKFNFLDEIKQTRTGKLKRI